jgi:hypothetical protein
MIPTASILRVPHVRRTTALMEAIHVWRAPEEGSTSQATTRLRQRPCASAWSMSASKAVRAHRAMLGTRESRGMIPTAPIPRVPHARRTTALTEAMHACLAQWEQPTSLETMRQGWRPPQRSCPSTTRGPTELSQQISTLRSTTPTGYVTRRALDAFFRRTRRRKKRDDAPNRHVSLTSVRLQSFLYPAFMETLTKLPASSLTLSIHFHSGSSSSNPPPTKMTRQHVPRSTRCALKPLANRNSP